MAHLVIGEGEIGTALRSVLMKRYATYSHDVREHCESKIDVLHICFPYSPEFVDQVVEYQARYGPRYTVIHSTVPVGTCRVLGALSSPVMGKHPYLERSLLTFTKFVAGEGAQFVGAMFQKAGMHVYLLDKPESGELLKLLSTLFYGVCIEFTKETKRLCDEYGVPFESWTLFTQAYNEGYERLGYLHYSRPLLVPMMQKVGGHCILANLDLLESEFCDLVRKRNE